MPEYRILRCEIEGLESLDEGDDGDSRLVSLFVSLHSRRRVFLFKFKNIYFAN